MRLQFSIPAYAHNYLFWAFIGALWPCFCLAQLRGLEKDGLIVFYEPPHEDAARQALMAAAEALPTLESALGLLHNPQRRISIILAGTQRDFERYAGQQMKPWTLGVALPGRRIVVKMLSPSSLRRVLVHELTHVLLEETAQQYGVEPPRWLHEGLAKLAADDFSQKDREILGQAIVQGRLLSLEELDEAFAGSWEKASLAYAQSYTFVRFLDNLRPAGGLADFLHNLALTQSVSRALLRTYGAPRETLEKAWLEQIQREYLRHGLPAPGDLALLLLLGGLFLVVHLLNRRRRRIIRQRLQEEERLRRILGLASDSEAEEGDPENIMP